VWLREARYAEVVTVTVDVGQADDLDEVRGRALAAGAVRAHVIDARETFAREHVLPALRDAAATARPLPLSALALPAVARALAEVAAIEAASVVAHAAADGAGGAGASPAAVIEQQLAVVDPALRVVAVAREMPLQGEALDEYVRAHGLPPAATRRQPHLLVRGAVNPSRAATTEAQVLIVFERGMPVAINGVAMSAQELIECLSLIGGQHGLGHGDSMPAPAALLLRAAFRAVGAVTGAGDGTVRLAVGAGTLAATMTSAPPAAAPDTEGTVLSR
jgi:argininosuccinate synthase